MEAKNNVLNSFYIGCFFKTTKYRLNEVVIDFRIICKITKFDLRLGFFRFSVLASKILVPMNFLKQLVNNNILSSVYFNP